MKLRLTVEFDQSHGGEKFRIECGPRDQLAWEAAGPNRAALRLMKILDCSLDDLYGLAFATLRRQGLWHGKERELRDQADIDLGWDDEPASDEPDLSDEVPTQEGPSTEQRSS